jgi:hypothetical protein
MVSGRWTVRLVWALLAAFLALVIVGRFRANFADMEAKIEALEMPEAYERRGSRRDGGKIAFFGEHARVTQAYVSPDDLETTCAALREHLAPRSPTVIERDNACTFHFQMRPALWAMAQLNFSYGATVTALRPKEGTPIWVHAYVVDRGL